MPCYAPLYPHVVDFAYYVCVDIAEPLHWVNTTSTLAHIVLSIVVVPTCSYWSLRTCPILIIWENRELIMSLTAQVWVAAIIPIPAAEIRNLSYSISISLLANAISRR